MTLNGSAATGKEIVSRVTAPLIPLSLQAVQETSEVKMQTELINELAAPSFHANNLFERVEAELVAQAKGGSVTAFENLVERYETRVFRLAQTIAHSREDAEEIMQDTFVQAFKHLPGFRGDSRFYTWLARITINAGLMKIRGRRRNVISLDDPVETQEGIMPREFEDWGPTPEQRYSQVELREILAVTIGELPRRYRIVFQLRDVEGFSTEETARALDLSTTAVKSRLRRARFKLRNSLDKYFRLTDATGIRLSQFARIGRARHVSGPADGSYA
jgi:RNA polymerase sigma-70 factor, ECF subfamily